MRVLKILGLSMGALVALMALALLAVWLLVNPNDYKDRISAAVKESTGRELAMPGDLKLSVYPWLALNLGPASIGNPRGFGDAPFATLQHAAVRVKLLPLLRKELEVGRIEIDGLDVRLVQNEDGKGNWEDWVSDRDATPQEPSPQSRELASLDLAGVAITNGRVAFEDIVAQNFNVEVGRVAPGATIPVEMKLDLQFAPDSLPMPLAAQFKLTLDLEKQQYALSQLELKGTVSPSGAESDLPWTFRSPLVDLNLAARTLAETTFETKVAAVQLSGTVAGTQLIDEPALSGRFSLQELPPRDLMKVLGIAPPVTRDASALTRVKAQGRYSWAKKTAHTDALELQLDDYALAGRIAYDTDTNAVDFALVLDHIDLDRYQPPPTDGEAAASDPIELPIDTLKPLRAMGSFEVSEIKIAGMQLTRLNVTMDARDGVARFHPLKAQLYGGQYSGDISLDMRPATPRLSLNENLSGINMAALMKDFLDSERLAGRGTLTAKLTATGRNGDQLLRTLRGTISTDLADGAVQGIDLWYAITQAQSLLQQRTLAGGTNAGRTTFETFKASTIVEDGVATTNDLLVTSQLLRVTGQGSSNMLTEALDYTLTATVLKAPPDSDAGIAQLARASIPIRITGTFEDPKIRPDLAGMAKARVQQEIEQKENEVKEKLKEQVQDRLKNLFNR